LHKVFNLPYVYDYVKKNVLAKRTHTNHENEHVRGIGQGEARHRKYKRLELGGCQTYDLSSD
jgi:hypothetical protein